MAEKGKMPPALLEHFKSKSEEKGEKTEPSSEESRESDKTKRKEAVKKARIRMEESSRKKGNDKTQQTGKAGS